ncbi:MAG: hypothetical protein ACOYON_05750 [Fimbriimonas sp.]
MISWASASDPTILALLSAHPRVQEVRTDDSEGIQFAQGDWVRSIRRQAPASLSGLVEMIDNNPMVCADDFALPSPLASLASIALGPIIDAGLLVEEPILLTSSELASNDLASTLAALNWPHGAILNTELPPLEGAVAVTAMALIAMTDDFDEIDELYEERYGRCFFIRCDDASEWDTRLVVGSQNALYRLRITPGDPHTLLRIQVMAASEGKVGAGQMVHAMNVMAGFEESLGIA